MRKLLKVLVRSRVFILAVLGAGIYVATSTYHISLWYTLLAGVMPGVVFGKVFCRWTCPIGLIMELIMSVSTNGKFSLYKTSKETSGSSYSCSKCLEYVAACPNGSLKYKM